MSKVRAAQAPVAESRPVEPPATPEAARAALAEVLATFEAGQDVDRLDARLAFEGARRFADAPGMAETFRDMAGRFAAHAKVEANPALTKLLTDLVRTGKLDPQTQAKIEEATGKVSFDEGRALEAAVAATTLRAGGPDMHQVAELERFLDSGVRDRDAALGGQALGVLGKIAAGALLGIGLMVGNPGPEVPIMLGLAAGFGIPAGLRSIGKREKTYGVHD